MNHKIKCIDSNNLIDYKDLSNSVLVKAVAEFYNFSDSFRDFEVLNDNEHYVEIEFKNYQQTRCSIMYQKTYNTIKLKKGIGGVNMDYIKFINNLIELKVYAIEK